MLGSHSGHIRKVGVSYLTSDGGYTLLVDTRRDSSGLQGVADHPGSRLVIGSSEQFPSWDTATHGPSNGSSSVIR